MPPLALDAPLCTTLGPARRTLALALNVPDSHASSTDVKVESTICSLGSLVGVLHELATCSERSEEQSKRLLPDPLPPTRAASHLLGHLPMDRAREAIEWRCPLCLRKRTNTRPPSYVRLVPKPDSCTAANDLRVARFIRSPRRRLPRAERRRSVAVF